MENGESPKLMSRVYSIEAFKSGSLLSGVLNPQDINIIKQDHELKCSHLQEQQMLLKS